MGKPPAVIIVARHGARLDAADEEWQSNSQSPYDSPLSYGGWTQTRALGARIASLLHAQNAVSTEDASRARRRRQSDVSGSDPSASQSGPPPSTASMRKTKVVIHTSPFLRCVQSSIAISAGMAQYHGNLVRLQARAKTPPTPKLLGAQSRAQTLDSKAFEDKYLGKIVSNESMQSLREEEDNDVELEKPILRIDACLGEWLSPDYYDFTTSPPPSNMMVALAKAELLRSAETIHGAKIFEPDGSATEFPGGGPDTTPVHHERSRSATLSMDALARAMPGHGSGSRLHVADRNGDDAITVPKDTQPNYAGYIPPTPTYALLHSAPIPQGYVAHARDACVEIDFAWDSMREPQLWGDGGVFGEEWSAMHRRFRGGVASMVNWYKEKDPDYDPQNDEKLANDNGDDDDDTDVVLIMMTHGAGCNALIGALTNQPVLMDIGMASLTMAVHKPRDTASQSPFDLRRNRSTTIRRRRRSSAVDVGIADYYDMKLMASTEHLRAGPDPLVIPQLAQPGSMPSIPELPRRGSNTPPSRKSNASEAAEQLPSKNSALGSMRRTTFKSLSTRNFSPSPSMMSPTSNGLWNIATPAIGETDGDTITEARDDTTGGAPETLRPPPRNLSVGDASAAIPPATKSPGLWGSVPKEDPRRRYTVGMRK